MKWPLVTRIARTAAGRGKISNEYDLSGVVGRFKDLEPQSRAAKDEAESG